jgi:hypothetical protein
MSLAARWDAHYWRAYSAHHPGPVETPITDLLHAVTGSNRLATWNRSRPNGGEWDVLRDLPYRDRAILAGAGWLRLGGEAPDVFADILLARGLPSSTVDPIAWYLATALAAVPEARRATRAHREARLVAREGVDTYYAHRNAVAVAAGFRSYRHYRTEKGWRG